MQRRDLRYQTAAGSLVIVAGAFVALLGVRALDHMTQLGLMLSIAVVPCVAALLNGVWRPDHVSRRSATVVPALAAYAGVLGASLAFGGRGFNWLWTAVIYSLFSAALGALLGAGIRRLTVQG